MTKKYYGTYEKDFANEYKLVVYHEDPPLKKSANGQLPERTPEFEIPSGFIDENGSPMLESIKVQFPCK